MIALLSGRPADPSWDARMRDLGAAMDEVNLKIGIDSVKLKQRRGTYYSVNTGISFGGGSMVVVCASRLSADVDHSCRSQGS